jgi:hypothetical protein
MSKTITSRKKILNSLPCTFSYSEARQAGISEWTLARLHADGLLERMGRGRYLKMDVKTDPDLIAIAGRQPLATLCLRSALARHGLTDDIPHRIDIALPAGSRPPSLRIPINWHRFESATFNLGRNELDLGGGFSIGLYSAERSIIDAFRLRRLEGPELGNEALRRWLSLPSSQPAQLLSLAASFTRTVGPLRATLQVLL